MNFTYNLKQDIETVLDTKSLDLERFSKLSKVSKRNILYSYINEPSNNTLDKIYSAIYNLHIRLNKAKAEVFEETYSSKDQIVLFHGAKDKVEKFSKDGSREICDFGKRLYLTKSIDSAISFVENYSNPSLYCFYADLKGLNILELDCDFDWMVAVSYYRGKLSKYQNHQKVQEIIKKIESCDLLIAPIADNKMFDILNQFAEGLINTKQAIHCLSASRLGKQYVIISDKALNRLKPIERLYLCKEEKEKSKSDSFERSLLIQSKLDFAKRNFRTEGEYIDEVLK